MGKAGKHQSRSSPITWDSLARRLSLTGVGQRKPQRADKGPGGGGTGLGEEVGEGDSLTSVLTRQMMRSLLQGFLEDF